MTRFNKTPTAVDPNPSQGKLHLRLTGFSQQSYLPIDTIVQAIDMLPSFHLEGLREILYLTDSQARLELMYSAPHEFTRRKGAFIQRERRIVIYGFDTPSLFYQVLFHEIGHYVFFLIISSTVKKEWVTRIFPNSACVTPYAAQNASEDFAETYACYILDPETLKQIPEKYRFMQNMVFSGAPHTLKEKEWG